MTNLFKAISFNSSVNLSSFPKYARQRRNYVTSSPKCSEEKTIKKINKLPSINVTVHGPNGTLKFASIIANVTKKGDVIALEGDLGAGKTTFARGFLRESLKDPGLEVTSPTYILDNVYPHHSKDFDVRHMDLYRLRENDDLSPLELEKAFERDVCLIEWPQRLGNKYPSDYLHVSINHPPPSSSSSISSFIDKMRNRHEDMMEGKGNDEEAEEDEADLEDNNRSISITSIGSKWNDRLDSIKDQLKGSPIIKSHPTKTEE